MRTYPRNSPEAAARLVALVLLADGHVCSSEFEALERLDATTRLGLAPGQLPQVLHTLCEDLLLGTGCDGSMLASVDQQVLAALMAEVDDPELQRTVLALAVAAARADRHLAEGEALVLDAAVRHWGLADAPDARRDDLALAA